MTPTDLLEHLEHVRQVPGGWQARCPAHPDRSPSLSIAEGQDGRLLLLCFAGCPTADVVAALGLTMRDLQGDTDTELRPVARRPYVAPEPEPADLASMKQFVDSAAARLAGPAQDHPAVRYVHDRFGLELDDVHRLGLGYTESMGGGPRVVVPFRDGWQVPRGLQARALRQDATVRWLSPRSPAVGAWSRIGWFEGRDGDRPVIVTEGPGDALTAVGLGYDAIAIRGAGNASHHGTQQSVAGLIGDRTVILAGDGDEAGQRFNAELAAGLSHHRVHVLRLPAGDLTDCRTEDWLHAQLEEVW